MSKGQEVPLTPQAILNARDDVELASLLSNELQRLVPGGNGDQLAKSISVLPIGLRSMAAVYFLDISLALDSLLEHFENFPGLRLAEETYHGLLELNLGEIAEKFHEAMLAIPSIDAYRVSTVDSNLEATLLSLSRDISDLLDKSGMKSLTDVWPSYARADPTRVVPID